ncbi:MAG: hypothetical protein IT458_07425 [Planctomycetes bacterium]|nr:hypothetical protein [Planctomycetota bacterium]
MRPLLPLLCTVLACALPAQSSRDTSFGEWPFLVGNMDGSIAKLVSDARNNNLDTIYINFFRADGPSSGTLWITDSAGRWNSAWGPVRPNGYGIQLVTLIQQARAAGLQVVAVMKCFGDNVQPTSAAHKQYLLQVIDYLVNSYDTSGRPIYDVDGIALDYVRFVGSGTGNDPLQVTNFVRDVRRVVGSLSIHAYLIANRYSFDGPVYDGAWKSYSSVIATLASEFGQHWEQLAPYVDVYMPMAYTANGSIYSTYALHQGYVRTAANYARQAVTRAGFPDRRVAPAIKTYSDGETCTDQTIDASITGALLGGANGYQAFRYGTLIGQPTWVAKMKQYAVEGPNLPLAELSTLTAGLTTRLDATASRDFDEPGSALKVRFDLDNDGVFETPFGANQPGSFLARKPGPLRVGVQVQDSQGFVGATTRTVRIPDPLFANQSTLSASFGGRIGLTLGAGAQGAGRTYLMLAGLSGSAPGVPLAPGLTLPLNFDGLTMGLLGAVNTPVFPNALGTLDAGGTGAAELVLPPGLGALAGRTLSFAALGADAQGSFLFVSNARAVFLLP